MRVETIGEATLHLGDCVDVMRGLEAASVDSIVTDPPYELGFMGKGWDATGIANSVEMWREALRVLKPGGHLLAFSGSRTYHRMVCAIEDAGFEIRDQIMWVYGSGFPKSLDVSKAIDKAAGAEREVVGERTFSGKAAQDWKDKGGDNFNAGGPSSAGLTKTVGVTAPATDAARQWQGWGTALKPAHEPIVVARKPLIGTVAANVLAHGTGALNIDASRVHSDDSAGYAYSVQRMAPGADQNRTGKTHQEGVSFEGMTKDGRWPANLIHDGSDEVLAAFPTEASRFFYCAKASRTDRNDGLPAGGGPAVGTGATMREREEADWPARNGNFHPTVKPTDLMRYLARMVTPPGGIVLDPFTGSGSTGVAALLEGFRFAGAEMSPEYFEIACARVRDALRQGFQPSLLLEAA